MTTEREAGRALGGVTGDFVRFDRVAGRIMKAESNQVVDGKEGKVNVAADSGSFDPGVVRVTGDVVKRGDQFGGRVSTDVTQQEIGGIIVC